TLAAGSVRGMLATDAEPPPRTTDAMPQSGSHTARWRRRVWLPVVALAAAWSIYKVRHTRRLGTPMVADSSCQTDDCTVADLTPLRPGAAPIRCQPWDIGTGVTGYVWPAPTPRAVLLLQHGYAE